MRKEGGKGREGGENRSGIFWGLLFSRYSGLKKKKKSEKRKGKKQKEKKKPDCLTSREERAQQIASRE